MATTDWIELSEYGVLLRITQIKGQMTLLLVEDPSASERNVDNFNKISETLGFRKQPVGGDIEIGIALSQNFTLERWLNKLRENGFDKIEHIKTEQSDLYINTEQLKNILISLQKKPLTAQSTESSQADTQKQSPTAQEGQPEKKEEPIETIYGLIKYPDTAISYIKNEGNGWEHIFDRSYGFDGPVAKEDLKHAKKINKSEIPSRMFTKQAAIVEEKTPTKQMQNDAEDSVGNKIIWVENGQTFEGEIISINTENGTYSTKITKALTTDKIGAISFVKFENANIVEIEESDTATLYALGDTIAMGGTRGKVTGYDEDNEEYLVEITHDPMAKNSSGKETKGYKSKVGEQGRMSFERAKLYLTAIDDETLKNSTLIGQNYAGDDVRVNNTNDKRFIKSTKNNKVSLALETPGLNQASAASFLRSVDTISLTLCSEAMVEDLAGYGVYTEEEFKKYAETIFSEYSNASSDEKLELETALYFSVENAIAKYIRRFADKEPRPSKQSVFDKLHELNKKCHYKTSPDYLELVGKGESVPAHVSPHVAFALSSISDASYNPDNGSLVVINPGNRLGIPSFSRKTTISVHEQNPEKSLAISKSLADSGRELSSEKPSFENAGHIVLNTSAGIDDTPLEIDGVSFYRKEFKEIISALETKDAKSSALFTFPVSNDFNGDDDPELDEFIEFIGQRYAIAGLGVIPSHIYSHDDNYNDGKLFTMSIAQTRENFLPKAPLDETKINTKIDTKDDMFIYSLNVISNLKKINKNNTIEVEDFEQVAGVEDFQTTYVPRSNAKKIREEYFKKKGEVDKFIYPVAKTPIFLDGPQRQALDDMVQFFGGDLDHAAANLLNMTVEELALAFTDAQIDAIMCSHFAELNGDKGFVLADQAGFGKTRPLAAEMLKQVNQGGKVVMVGIDVRNIHDIIRESMAIGVQMNELKYIIFNEQDEMELHCPFSGQAHTIPKTEKDKLMEAMATSEHATDPETNEFLYQKDEEGEDLLDEFGNRVPVIKYGAKWPVVKDEDGNEHEVDVVFTSYSQVTKKPEKCDPGSITQIKNLFFHDAIDENVTLILDEAHKAAGPKSATGANIRKASAVAKKLVYASATPVKNAQGLAYLEPFLPDGVNMDDILEIAAVQGETALEALCTTLASQGSIRCLQQDETKAEFSTRPTSNKDLYLEYQRILAPIFSAMAVLSGDINHVISADIDAQKANLAGAEETIANANALFNTGAMSEEEEREHRANLRQANNTRAEANNTINDLKSSKVAFGKTQASLQKAVEDALTLPDAIEEAIMRCERGEKPLLVLSSTHDTVIERKMQEMAENGEEHCDPLSLKDIMKDHFLRMVTQKVTRTIEDEETGETHEEIVDQFYHPDDADVQAEIQNILGMIDNIPFLEASGFDAIPRAMNAAGHNFGDVTGRSWEYNYDERKFEKRKKKSKSSQYDRYNNGDCVGLCLSLPSANASWSGHDSDKFENKGKRSMQFVSMPASATMFEQMMRRIIRMGSRSIPEIVLHSSGGAASIYSTSQLIANVARQSAGSTGNRQSKSTADHEFIDFFNSVGDTIINHYFESNPEYAEIMGFTDASRDGDVEDDLDNAYDTTKDNKRTGRSLFLRLACLDPDMQEKVIDDLTKLYCQRIEELDAEGTNPLTPKIFRGRVITVKRELFEGSEGVTRGWDAPVWLETCRLETDEETINSDALLNKIQSAEEQLHYETSEGKADEIRADKTIPLTDTLNKIYDEGFAPSLEEALADEESDQHRKLIRRNRDIERLANLVERIKPGSQIEILNQQGQPEKAIVSYVRYPDTGQKFNAADYSLQYHFVGDTDRDVRKVSFASLLKNTHFYDPERGFKISAGLSNSDDAVEGQSVQETIEKWNTEQGDTQTYESICQLQNRPPETLTNGEKKLLDEIAVNSMSFNGICSEFDQAGTKQMHRTIEIFTGNPTRIQLLNAKYKLGTVVNYQDQYGVVKRGVLAQKGLTLDVRASVPVRIKSASMALDLLATDHAEGRRRPELKMDEALIGKSKNMLSLVANNVGRRGEVSFTMTLPSTRSNLYLRSIRNIPEMDALYQKVANPDARGLPKVTLTREEALVAVNALTVATGKLYEAAPRYRDWQNEWSKATQLTSADIVKDIFKNEENLKSENVTIYSNVALGSAPEGLPSITKNNNGKFIITWPSEFDEHLLSISRNPVMKELIDREVIKFDEHGNEVHTTEMTQSEFEEVISIMLRSNHEFYVSPEYQDWAHNWNIKSAKQSLNNANINEDNTYTGELDNHQNPYI